MYDVTVTSYVKIAKIVKKKKSLKSRVFAIFATKMYTYVVVIDRRVHLGMAFIKITSIKYKLCKYLLTKS